MYKYLRVTIDNIHITSYHIVVLKWQNCLKVGTDKSKLKVKTQSVSDDDVRKRVPEKPRFELAVKGVFALGKCYILWQCVPSLWASNWKSTATDGWSLYILHTWHHDLTLTLIQPPSKWIHWATLRRHSGLSRAATSASSQVSVIFRRSFLTVPIQLALGRPDIMV